MNPPRIGVKQATIKMIAQLAAIVVPCPSIPVHVAHARWIADTRSKLGMDEITTEVWLD